MQRFGCSQRFCSSWLRLKGFAICLLSDVLWCFFLLRCVRQAWLLERITSRPFDVVSVFTQGNSPTSARLYHLLGQTIGLYKKRGARKGGVSNFQKMIYFEETLCSWRFHQQLILLQKQRRLGVKAEPAKMIRAPPAFNSFKMKLVVYVRRIKPLRFPTATQLQPAPANGKAHALVHSRSQVGRQAGCGVCVEGEASLADRRLPFGYVQRKANAVERPMAEDHGLTDPRKAPLSAHVCPGAKCGAPPPVQRPENQLM